ncbi:MAG TPA: hypothetical protein VKQ36_17365 [Ktedonobacterales bacterium]|nr:hypothetical protein [Ktedonobacterales bacterium]
MKQFVVELSDDVAQQVELFAHERQQSPEESLVTFVEVGLASTKGLLRPPTKHGSSEEENDEAYTDPWAGFHGAFQSPYPDLTSNHDYYIAAEAINPHEPDEDSDERQ